jgi:hypothetical protein
MKKATNDVARRTDAATALPLIESLKLSATFSTGKVIKQITTVEIRKPAKDEWFCADANWSVGPIAAITSREEISTIYLVKGSIAEGLSPSDYKLVTLHPCVTTKQVFFFWPVAVSDRPTNWDATAQKAVELAKTGWTRMAANMAASGYDVWSPQGVLAEPVWPQKSFEDLLEIALSERLVDTDNHPIMLKLRGAF